MKPESHYNTRRCIECATPYTRKPSEGIGRFEKRSFCCQTCSQAFRKRVVNKIGHPAEVLARMGG